MLFKSLSSHQIILTVSIYVIQSSGVVAISTTAVTPTDIILMPEIPLFGEHSSQSSIGGGGRPALALDGNTDGDYSHGSCTHTVDGNNSAWWAVDMQQLYCVGRVVIYNRNDCYRTECYGDRLDGAIIRVGNDSNTLNNPVFGRVGANTVGDVIQLTCGLTGRFISVHNNQDIHICELKAYAGYCKTTREHDFICDDGLTSIPNCVRCDAEAYCTDRTDEIDCAGSTANEATAIGPTTTEAAGSTTINEATIGPTTTEAAVSSFNSC
ncbi:fucolectin-3-like [Amphiura filiformis]|uniref:fucolectin-3-like n=1 Tax=Amphiura filiformis TaxID=82378 RepID=UPI003B2231E6